MEDYLRVGIFANTHGIRGEIKVFPTTDDVNRFGQLKKVIMDTKKGHMSLEIEGVKFFKNMAILKFKGIDNINEIEKYKGSDLLIQREDAVPLEEGEYFIADLIGLKAITDEGTELGILTNVIQTGANDVYVIRMSERELLLPVIPDCILNIDLDAKEILVHLMEGLMDL